MHDQGTSIPELILFPQTLFMYAMNGRELQRLDLAVAPGKSLGWFRLGTRILVIVSKLLIEAHMISTFKGTSIWDVINFLREQSRIIPSVDFMYSEEVLSASNLTSA